MSALESYRPPCEVPRLEAQKHKDKLKPVTSQGRQGQVDITERTLEGGGSSQECSCLGGRTAESAHGKRNVEVICHISLVLLTGPTKTTVPSMCFTKNRKVHVIIGRAGEAGDGGMALGAEDDCRRRTWPSFAAVWTSFSTLSRTEQLCFR